MRSLLPVSDAEVISVELSRPGEGLTPEAKNSSLEESLEQIERLAAELSELTAANATGQPSDSLDDTPPAPEVSVPHDPLVRLGAPRPAPRRPRPVFSWCSSPGEESKPEVHEAPVKAAAPAVSAKEPAAGNAPAASTPAQTPPVAPKLAEPLHQEADAEPLPSVAAPSDGGETATTAEMPAAVAVDTEAEPTPGSDSLNDATKVLPPLPRIGCAANAGYRSAGRVRSRAPEAIRFAGAAAAATLAPASPFIVPGHNAEHRVDPEPNPFDFANNDDDPVFVEPITEYPEELEELKAEKRRRRRKFALGVLAALLAIPAFALGAIQPWLSDNPPDDRVEVSASERHGRGAEIGPQPNPAVPNASKEAEPTPAPDGSGSGNRRTPAKNQQAPAEPSTSMRRGPATGLSVNVRANNAAPTVGESVEFNISWSDGEGQLAGIRNTWGDGTPGGDSTSTPRCDQNQLDTSGQQALRHTFTQPGTYTVSLTVVTYTCDGATEEQTVPLSITVAPKPTTTPSSSTMKSSVPPTASTNR